MDDIAGIEARLSAALDRIASGVERVAPPDKGAAEAAEAAKAKLAEMTAALEAEKSAHGQLSERVKAIREKQEQNVASLEDTVKRLQEQVAAQGAELGQLRRVNAALRDTAAKIRKAVADGGLEEGVLNEALAAELEATRAAQSADRRELDAILAELTPLIEEGADV